MTFLLRPRRYDSAVTRSTYALGGALVLTLLVFGGVADHALVEQARTAEEASRAEHDKKTALTAQSVRATLAEVEQAVLGDNPWPGVSVGRLVDPDLMSAPGPSSVPYRKLSEEELVAHLSSTHLSGSGLPEAVVAAVALGRSDHKREVAERLLSGRVPVRTEDLPYLAEALGVASDSRVTVLRAQLSQAPEAARLPMVPRFQRRLVNIERGTIEGWSRGEAELRRYEIPVGLLLNRAGVAESVVIEESSRWQHESGRRIVAIPEVEGLTLAVALDGSGPTSTQTLRLVLWVAVLTSVVGLAAVVRGLRREAKAVSREKAFLTGVTHELRTPLTAIRLLGQRLAEGRGDSAEYGSMVVLESERLEAFVERALATTRADEKMSFTRLDPGALVRSAVALLSARAEQRNVTLAMDDSIHEAELPEVSWDGKAVRRALLNLLDNAIKHGREDGHVEVHAAVEHDAVKLSVTDDGPGIRRRDRKRVFGRFERGGTETTGTGLGLYVVDRVARAHGGRVDLVTDENRGSTFTLVLPLEPPGATIAATGEKRPKAPV